MKSRVSSNRTRNIHRPSTPEKEVNRKENTVGKATDRDGFEILRILSSRSWRGSILYLMFCDKENRDLWSMIYRVFFGGIS